jgi:hypothetical protein
VTLPPYQPPTPDPGPPAEPAAESSAGAPRSRRRLVIAAAVVGALALGGGGYAVASYLSGGGTQPEDVLPADTLGFVKIDLDPAAGQKVALASLLEKFPDVSLEGDDDIRGLLLEPLLELTGDDVDYAADVRPWLGDRLAVGAVPAEDTEAGVAPVVVLAVTDEAEMTDTLTRVQEGTEIGFAVREDYVLITDSQERADAVAAAEETLADDADFAGDLEALDGDQVAVAWGDLTAAQDVLAAQAAAAGASVTELEALSGRVILGVHAEEDALEMVGLDFSVSDARGARGEPTRLIQDLPDDTAVALSGSGFGDGAVEAWGALEESGALAQAGVPIDELGLDLPEDLRAILGTDLVVAAFGDLDSPAFGARVRTGQPEVAERFFGGLLSSPELGIPAVFVPADDGYVLAGDEATADALTADGGLGETEAFQAAVADPDAATAIGFLDLGAVIEQLRAEGGDAAAEAERFAAVEALGFSASGTDEGGRFVLRITTR